MGARLTRWAPLGLRFPPVAAFWAELRVSGMLHGTASLWSVRTGWTSGPRFLVDGVLGSGLGSLVCAAGEGAVEEAALAQSGEQPTPPAALRPANYS
ncbi:hypothetical protein PAL_GLEAN10001871 [Pteropus alecto]|uniref:Uncharacterized protein n=1 Tax=Pteropus alecto TaxID=9402 RepID=L5KC88_PTEAL|nr:hypothetical protein PAL_GLEAN10001871 [Pteropus alecto]